MRRVAALALLVLLPSAADAAVCTSTASFVWTSIGSGSWSCGSGGAEDSYVIGAGHTVQIAGSLTQSGSSAGITVASGGTLTVSGRYVLTLGGAGLVCQPSSLCQLEGAGFREPDAERPDLAAELSAGRVWNVQQIVHCPDATGSSACGTGGADHVLRLRFPEGAPGGTSRIEPGDVLCFGGPVPEETTPGADAGFCYEVVNDPGDGGSTDIDIDVRQSPGGRDSAGYPFAWRTLRASTVRDASGVSTGDRAVMVGDTVLSASHQLVGRWLRFADGAGSPEPRAYKIMSTLDGGAGDDVITIGDARGVTHAAPQGRTVWIDYGWSRGDAFYVYAPLRIQSATSTETDSQLRLAGNVSVRRALFDGLGSAYDGQQSTGAILLQPTAQVAAFEDAWLADPATPPSGIAFMIDSVSPVSIQRFQQTGGTSSASGCSPYTFSCADYLHVFGFRGAIAASFSDIAVRHHGDDVFLNAAAWPLTLTLRRIHAAFVSRYASSANLLDMSALLSSLDARDLICDDCASAPNGADGAGPFVSGLDLTTGGIENVLVWGTRGGVACDGGAVCRKLLAIGASGEKGYLLGGHSENVVVRDVQFTHAAAGIAKPNQAMQISGALVRNASFGNQQGMSWPSVSGAEVEISDSAFVDVNGPATSYLFNGGSLASSVTLRNVSTVWTGPHTVDRSLTAYTAANVSALVLDRLLVQGLDGPGEFALVLGLSQVTSSGASCFFGNTYDWPASQAPFVPAEWIHGVPAGQSPRLASYPWNTAGCGAQGVVGISEPSWLHAKSRIEPEFFGDADADGLASPDDNCALVANSDQTDTDGDGRGDLCDDECVGDVPATLDGVFPASGPAGQIVEVSGQGLSAQAQVFFDGIEASPLTGLDKVVAKVPAGLAVGSHAVTVVNPEGCRPPESVTFTVTVPPPTCGLLGVEALLVPLLAALRRSIRKIGR
ncbi:MAG: hypothetical protein IT386_12295 [Deltaproteobacteria bacterium]|nr:hypothetical protein [Deltaproteobacteria bacterium]